MCPNQLLNELAETAFWQGQFFKNNRRDLGKPGEFLTSLSEEQREILRQLKSDDLDVRFDAVKWMM